MFLAYVFSLVVGGVFLGVSALLGAKDAGDGDADGDGGLDAHGDVDANGDAHGVLEAHGSADDVVDVTWMPFLSLQFWMFALAFFGLTGTVLETLGLAGALLTGLSATVLGLGAGSAASYSLHKLKHDKVESSIGSSDFIGRNGQVLIPVAKGQTGKIRVQVKGQLVDLMAKTDEAVPIGQEEEVLVIEMREHVALVVRRIAKGEEVGSEAPAQARRKEGG